MNRFLKITTAIIFVLTAFGCSEEFLEVDNENNISENSFYKTNSDFEDLTITAYCPLAYSNLFAQEMQTFGFAIDDRILHERSDWDQLQYNSTSGEITNIFIGLYTGIFRTNLFLEKINDDIVFLDPERRNTMTGEIYFLRGLYYFYVADWFEVGPLLTETAKDPMQGQPNSTQKAIYAQVESDLLMAIELLPETWDDNDLGRVTKGAAKSMLGKAYLYQAKFSEATSILGEVISSGQYALNMPKGTDSIDFVNAYLSNFTSIDMPGSADIMYDSEFNTESIFEVNFSLAVDNGTTDASQWLPGRRSTGSLITWYNGSSSITSGSFGNIAMEDQEFPKEFEIPVNHAAGLAFDPRYYATFIRVGDIVDFREGFKFYNKPFEANYLNSVLPSEIGMRKQLYPYHTSDVWSNAPFCDPNNWRLIRYADVLLMYAEAAFRSGSSAGITPLDALNQVRERVGMEPLSALNKEAIIHERDIELACENSRFWDLGRWLNDGWIDLAYINQTLPNYEAKHVCLPIPLQEIQRHYGVLKQNPKWE
ncbi:MAG: RagB/SusD family nutrient uptake outer membrane protein [Prolixibacteraceae bacterium]